MEKEFERMDMNFTEWRISDLNTRFQLCENYPRHIIVPRTVSDAELLMSCRYRKEGRVPVLSWIHRNQSFLCHSACPISENSKSTLSKEDDKLLAAIITSTLTTKDSSDNNHQSLTIASEQLSSGSNSGSSNFSFSFTGRRYSAETSNQSKSKTKKLLKQLGKRGEKGRSKMGNLKAKEEFYNFYFIDLIFRSEHNTTKPREILEEFPNLSGQISIGCETILVDNLSDLRESYKKLKKLCVGNFNINVEEHWLNTLDNTRWLDQLKNVMYAASRVVELMEFGTSVFLTYPCNWDRGCQISALSQLWMDPYYRTIKGFIVLIEKEWLSFGHNFADRSCLFNSKDHHDHQHNNASSSSNTISSNDLVIPIFIQWLDAVWQTLQQFPNYFEFTNTLLVEIAEESFSGTYGTFLSNNEQFRRTTLHRMNTESFWSHVIDNFQYRNPFYMPSPESTLVPSFNPRILSLWTSFYLRWYTGPFSSKIPRIPQSCTGNDCLAITNLRELSVKQELERHILSLETALHFIQNEIDSKHEVLDLVRRGSNLSVAIHQVINSSKDKSMTDIMGLEAPPSPIILRRKSKLSNLQPTSLSKTDSSKNLRRSSVPDNSASDSNTPVSTPPQTQTLRKRQSRSVYLKKEDVDKMLDNFDGSSSIDRHGVLDLPDPLPSPDVNEL